jgi:hypothetical protein
MAWSTLTGAVDSQAERVAAERAVRRADGVRSVANDLRIRARDERTDTDIARDAANRLRNNVAVPESVQAVVSDGYVTSKAPSAGCTSAPPPKRPSSICAA